MSMNKFIILFFEFFKISLFTIGGGLAMIPIIEDTFVKKHNLLKSQDIIEMISITQNYTKICEEIYKQQKLN